MLRTRVPARLGQDLCGIIVPFDRAMQQLQAPLLDAAIVEDADIQLGLDRRVVAALGERIFESTGDSNHPGAFMRELARAIRPSVVPDPVDPAFEQCRHRPPVDREDHHGRLVTLDPLHLAPHLLGIDLVGIVPVRLVGLAQHRIELLLRQVGELERVTVDLRRLAECISDLTGQRRFAGMRNDKQCLHRWLPLEAPFSLAGKLRKSYRRQRGHYPIGSPTRPRRGE